MLAVFWVTKKWNCFFMINFEFAVLSTPSQISYLSSSWCDGYRKMFIFGLSQFKYKYESTMIRRWEWNEIACTSDPTDDAKKKHKKNKLFSTYEGDGIFASMHAYFEELFKELTFIRICVFFFECFSNEKKTIRFYYYYFNVSHYEMKWWMKAFIFS